MHIEKDEEAMPTEKIKIKNPDFWRRNNFFRLRQIQIEAPASAPSPAPDSFIRYLENLPFLLD
jgi:hypothetical protein